MLWDTHPDLIGKLHKKFWEEEKLWYKCIDEKNEGIVTGPTKKTGITVGYAEEI